jgi:hypothetical protein
MVTGVWSDITLTGRSTVRRVPGAMAWLPIWNAVRLAIAGVL